MDTIETRTDSTFLQIIREIRHDITSLFRQEVALAKSEIKVKAIIYGKDAILIGVSALVGLCAILFLLLALCNLIAVALLAAGLSAAMTTWIAPSLLGLLLCGGAFFSGLKALKAITGEKPLPHKVLAARHPNKVMLTEKAKG